MGKRDPLSGFYACLVSVDKTRSSVKHTNTTKHIYTSGSLVQIQLLKDDDLYRPVAIYKKCSV